MTELTVIVTAHNRADVLDETLSSLADQEWADGDWDIVLVDNDSTDDTPQLLQRWVDKMPVPTTIVTATDAHTASYARGAGVAATDATGVAFLDDDDVLGVGFVAAIGTALRSHRLVGSRHELGYLNDPTMVEHRGSFQTSRLGELFGVPVCGGGGMACRRELWNELGGQKLSIGYGGQDVEYCLRAHQVGATAVFAPDAVYHVRLRDKAGSSFHQARLYSVGRVRLYRMHRDHLDHRPETLRRTVRRWAGLVRRLPDLRHPGTRNVWMWQLGIRVGHLQGSLVERTWYP